MILGRDILIVNLLFPHELYEGIRHFVIKTL